METFLVDPPSHRPGALAADPHGLRGGYGPLGGCGQAPQRRARLRRCGRCRPQQDPIRGWFRLYQFCDEASSWSARRDLHDCPDCPDAILYHSRFLSRPKCNSLHICAKFSATSPNLKTKPDSCNVSLSLLSEYHGFLRILRIDLSKVLIRLMPRSQYLRAVWECLFWKTLRKMKVHQKSHREIGPQALRISRSGDEVGMAFNQLPSPQQHRQTIMCAILCAHLRSEIEQHTEETFGSHTRSSPYLARTALLTTFS